MEAAVRIQKLEQKLAATTRRAEEAERCRDALYEQLKRSARKPIENDAAAVARNSRLSTEAQGLWGQAWKCSLRVLVGRKLATEIIAGRAHLSISRADHLMSEMHRRHEEVTKVLPEMLDEEEARKGRQRRKPSSIEMSDEEIEHFRDGRLTLSELLERRLGGIAPTVERLDVYFRLAAEGIGQMVAATLIGITQRARDRFRSIAEAVQKHFGWSDNEMAVTIKKGRLPEHWPEVLSEKLAAA